MSTENFLKDIKYIFGFSHFIGKAFARTRNSETLNQSQKKTLMFIGDNPGLTLKELSHTSVLDKGALSRIVQSLVQEGLLERQSDNSDRRKILINLTKKGMNKTEEIKRHLHSRIEEQFSCLSRNELEELIKASETIKKILTKLEENQKKK